MNSTKSMTRAHARPGFTLIETLVVIGIIAILASLTLAVSSVISRTADERNTRNTLAVLDAAVEEYQTTTGSRITYRTGPVPGGVAEDPFPANSGYRWDVWYSQRQSSAIPEESPPPGSGSANWSTGFAKPYSTLDLVSGQPSGFPSYSMAPHRRTAKLIALLAQSPTTQSVLEALPESVYKGVASSSLSNVTPLGLRHVIDAWDVPIIAVFPGRDAAPTDAANTIDADGTIRCDSEWGRTNSPSSPHSEGGMLISCKNRRILWAAAGPDSKFHTNPTTLSTDNLYSYEP